MLSLLNYRCGGREESGCLKILLFVQKTQIGFKRFAEASPQSYFFALRKKYIFLKALNWGRCRHSHPLDTLLFLKHSDEVVFGKIISLYFLQLWKGGLRKKKSELPGYKLLSLTQFINCTPCWLWARCRILRTCSKVSALMEDLAAICSRATASLVLKFSSVGVGLSAYLECLPCTSGILEKLNLYEDLTPVTALSPCFQ